MQKWGGQARFEESERSRPLNPPVSTPMDTQTDTQTMLLPSVAIARILWNACDAA